MNLALSCDIRIAAESAFFDTGFLKLNLHPGGGHTWLLMREIGLQGTEAMAIFGETLDGRAAERKGLAWKCVPDDQLLDAARKMAGYAASKPRDLVRHVDKTINEMISTENHHEAVETEFERQMWSVHQPEFKDAIDAMKARISKKA